LKIPRREAGEMGEIQIKKISYTHDAVIDLIIEHPEFSQGEIARQFGYTEAWLSVIINSDSFQVRLAERKSELIDPRIRATIEDKMKGAVSQSLDILAEKLEKTKNQDLAIKVLEIGSKALGYGVRQNNVAVQANFVVALPGKSASSQEWAAAHTPGGVKPIEVEKSSSTPPPILDIIPKVVD
jgi:hypothetical protein